MKLISSHRTMTKRIDYLQEFTRSEWCVNKHGHYPFLIQVTLQGYFTGIIIHSAELRHHSRQHVICRRISHIYCMYANTAVLCISPITCFVCKWGCHCHKSTTLLPLSTLWMCVGWLFHPWGVMHNTNYLSVDNTFSSWGNSDRRGRGRGSTGV